MTYRIAVVSKIPDARARNCLRTLQARFPRSALASAALAQLYTIEAMMPPRQIERAARALTNQITETYSIGRIPSPPEFAYALEIGFLPGVTDNLGRTAKQTIEDAAGKTFKSGEGAYSSLILFLGGALSERDARAMARELHNPLIERAAVFRAGERIPIVVPKVILREDARAEEVDLDVGDEELARIGREGIANRDGSRRGPLSLSPKQLRAIRDHFRSIGRKPTDLELESLAQTWSEHCKHTIFNDPLDDIEEGIYRRYIKGATEKIRKQKGKKDFCVSVFKDNSGAIAFDEKHLVTHKVETHNAPSALDPYGGALTAIVGVNRDCLGFGLGAKPIANTYGFCVADPRDARELFRDAEKTRPLLPARRILEGVVRGINAGGNQSGIPTPLGFVAVDPNFRGKPLVFGGTVGLIPRSVKGKKLYEKKARPGDWIVMIGGRVGLDGVHGATFSSESLSAGSPATAVQIGDPITQKKFLDALVREARDARLYSSITDDGAGGLSGSVGEMARESGGCDVVLEKVPLKYPGLSPWQIWLSESQERMTLAVPKKNWNKLKEIFDRHGVEAARIGTFTKSGRCVVRFEGKTVMNIKLDFLHEGRPIELQKSTKVRSQRDFVNPQRDLRNPFGSAKALLEMLARPSIGSISFVSQQYDHEVQGSSATKPLQGRGRVNADAGVLQPLPDSRRGIVLSHGYAPWYSKLDAYAMAAAAIDTAVRNAVCAGASRGYLALLDNFCWSSSDSPERLHELKEAARACYDVAVAYGTPFISGKDSMFNDFRGFDAEGNKIHVAALPTLLISALGVVPDVRRAMTLDFKRAGDLVYLIGETNGELGASEYCEMRGEGFRKSPCGEVPKVDPIRNAKAYDALAEAIARGLIASAIGVGRGGLAVVLAKSAIAGHLGASARLARLPGGAKDAEAILFSESQGRMLVSVRADARERFERLFEGIALAHIGEVVQAREVSMLLPKERVEIPLSALAEAYRSFFKQW